MRKNWVIIILAAGLLAACGGQPAATPTETIPTPGRPTSTPPPTATPIITPVVTAAADEGHQGLPLASEREELFSTSGLCTICHFDMTDETGKDVSIDTYWRATMMANAARDPYWQAVVRAEVLANPEAQEVIEDTCATCHMPMARFIASTEDELGLVFEGGFSEADHPLHAFGMDGVSCTLCHQVEEEGLGFPGSYSGGFVIDVELPEDERLAYGPYAIDDASANQMQTTSGYRPVQGLHLSGSTLCASCHTLYTPTFDANGRQVGEFPEQMIYFEWYYSRYRQRGTCQYCHMPEAQGGVRSAVTTTTLRSPFSQHAFVGGNTAMLRILEAFGAQLGVTASSEQLEAGIERTLDQLQERTATISFDRMHLGSTRLTMEVVIESHVGHKFPAGYPSRRAWLHFTIQDGDGVVIFESGAVNPDGSIVGNANDEDPQAFEPHYFAIDDQSQVQIYEAILRDLENGVTTELLRAAGYLKDNRLLAEGSQKSAPYPDIAVRGRARDDEDFQGGGDRIMYIADIGNARGPFTVTVELLYQAVAFRWVENLRPYAVEEVERFLSYVEEVPILPEVVASETVEMSR